MNVHDWLVEQIEGCAPKRDLAPGNVGRPIADLASVVRILEDGGGTLFGMHVSCECRLNDSPLLRKARVPGWGS